MSPERPGSPQDELVQMPKMSVPASPVAGTPIREAQSPMSILLAVAQCAHNQNKTADDDLTSLSWLQDKDLLKGMNINPSPSNSLNTTPIKYYNNHNGLLSDQSPTSDFIDDSSTSAAESSSSSIHSPTPLQQTPAPINSTISNSINNNNHLNSNNNNTANQRNKHPHNIPYDPLIHTNNKPPYSFSCLIFMAIEDSQQKALPVKEIYAWILDHFPYFKNAPTGWKNSVRHNLSLNKCFQKVEKAPNLGKGSLWTVDPQYKGNLIQALTRSPFHPCSTLDPSLYFNNNNNNNNLNNINNNNNNNNTSSNNKNNLNSEKNNSAVRLPNPDLFPFLSRKLANEMGANSDSESLDAADAAAVMLSLKHGPRLQKRVWQVITTSPSQDHTYSAADSDEAPSRSPKFMKNNRTCRRIDFESDDSNLNEEQRRFHEGAVTLLKLANGDAARRRSSLDDLEAKRFKLREHSDEEECVEECAEERKEAFKPRLLRAKRKDAISHQNNVIHNNNNNNEDEWAKSRRELEISSQDR